MFLSLGPPIKTAVEQATVNRLAGGSNPSRGASFLKARSAVQVTVFKRLTFWNRRLCFHGVDKVSDILLQYLPCSTCHDAH